MGLYLNKELPFGISVDYWKITSVSLMVKKNYVFENENSSEVEFVLSGYVSKELRNNGKEPICNNIFKCGIDVLTNVGSDIRAELYQSVKANPEWYTAIDDI